MRVGVLGLGSIGLRHARNAKTLGHEVFCFDPDERKQTLGTTYGLIAASRDAVLACDKVVVASPTPQHHQDLKDTMACPSVLAEKPLSDQPIDFNLDHIDLVGYNLRYHAAVKQAKQWLDSNAIGRPLHADFILAQFNERPEYLRDGVVLNWSHEIDLALHLLGKAEALSTVCKNNTIADLFLQHPGNGAVSSIHLNYVNKREQRYFNIVGTKGRITCVLSPVRCADCVSDDGSVYSYNFDTTFDEDYIKEMKAFLNDDIGPGCTADQAKDVLKICLVGT